MLVGKVETNKKQIILKLSGGLGNQLWQLAFAYQIMHDEDMEEILIDLRTYKKDKYRKPEIDSYCLPDYIKMSDKKNVFIKFDFLCFIYSKYRGLYFRLKNRYIDNRIEWVYKNGYFISHNNYIKLDKLRLNKIYIYGYFQNIKNIQNILPLFKKLLIPNNDCLSDLYYKYLALLEHPKMNYTAVSVRCGTDYHKLNWDICNEKYFKIAMRQFKESTFVVFSDDIEKAKQLFKNIDVIFIPQLNPIEQLELMRKCSGFILSNSTFSYWGALLAEKKEAKIVFPRKWFPYLETKDAEILFGNYIIVG